MVSTVLRSLAAWSTFAVAACAESSTHPLAAPVVLDAGGRTDANLETTRTPHSEALCDAALRYKSECNPSIYYRSCEELFQQLGWMDAGAQQAATACFR